MIRFAKWHALRNDFILVSESERGTGDPGRLARCLCDRHAGPGADGLILFSAGEEGRAQARIFNADGGEAGISGNGFRCTAGALFRMGRGEKGSLELESSSGISRHVLDGEDGGLLRITSYFGPPRFGADSIPVDPGTADPSCLPFQFGGATVEASCVSVGNPHAVFLDGWDDGNWMEIGRMVERHEVFPEGTNVEFVRVLGRDRIEVFVWERGVGRTASSGTGAAASFSVARKRRLVGEKVEVLLEGGKLMVHEEDGGLAIAGTCTEVYRGTLADPPAGGAD